VACKPPKDVVGWKKAQLTIAGQTVEFPQGLIYSRCYTELLGGEEVKYYGVDGQLCAVCPTPGAFCVNGSKEEPLSPLSEPGFWRLALNIRCKEKGGSDGLGACKKFENDVHAQRALGKEHPRPEVDNMPPARCPRERWDQSLRREFPNLREEETCYDFAGCRPKEACTGNNTCREAYQWTLKKCWEWETLSIDGKPNSGKGNGSYACVTHSDCRTRSGGPEREDGADCRHGQPEDCAICVNRTNTTTGEVTGHCQCAPAQRCSLCTVYEYYQFNGECVPCPKNPGLIFALFGCGIIAAIIMGKVLSNKRFNLAFISIGVDYFQVLALFAYAKIKWPTALKKLMEYFSIFNLNADLTAPECLVPDLEYEHKWYAYMVMPLASTVLLFVYVILHYLFKRCFLGQRRSARLWSHGAPIVGVQLIMLYYMYMMLARRVFYIFNCVDTEPSDGYQYTEFTSIECVGGVCRCWVPGGVQMRLVYWSIPAIIIYVVGFPVYVLYIVKKYKELIKEDQLLRAMGYGDSRLENPFAYFVRVRYHRIYYHFKPSKTYWFLYVLFRKLAICTVGVVLREQPGFQLSVTMLALFLCFWLQQKHRPYMSSVERAAVVANHIAKAEEGITVHVKIAARIESVKGQVAHKKSVKHRTVKSLDASHFGSGRNDRKIRDYFWDYNTVESVLLACSILICLAGVMFESDRFEDDPDGTPSRFAWQRELITYCTILLVFGSLIYYGTVFLSETGIMELKCLVNLFADKKKAIHRKNERDGGEADGEIGMSENPMMMARGHAAREAKLKADFEAENAAERAEMEAAAAKLQDALLKAKREKRNAGPITGGSRGNRGRKIKKKGFSSRQVDIEGDDPETDLFGSAEIELVVTTENREEKQATQKKKKKKKKALKGRQHRPQTASSSGGETSSMGEPDRPESVGDYDSVMDHSTGRPYYVHRQTGVSSWTLPEDSAVTIEGTNPAFSVYNTSRDIAPSSAHERQRSFMKHQTPSRNRVYFEEVGTGITVWDLPEDSIVL
jgi:hypothetical protein